MNKHIERALNEGISYEQYREMIDQLLENGKTTGTKHTEDYVHYTKMNVQRMKKWDKIAKVQTEQEEAIKAISEAQHWIILTEAWCGDAAHALPIIHKLAALNDKISTYHVLRDEHSELMDQFLTNGGRSIPKVIMLDHNKELIGDWGPRPAVLQEMIRKNKESENPIPYSEFSQEVQKWYAKDKGKSIQKEFMAVQSTSANAAE